MSEWKDEKKRITFLVDDSEHFRLQALARIHYEGKLGMLCRALITMSLEDIEAGHKKIGLKR